MFRFENVKKQRERRKTKAEKGKDKKEEESFKDEKSPFRWGCFMADFDYRTGELFRFLTQPAHPLRLQPYIYMPLGQSAAYILGLFQKKNRVFGPFLTREVKKVWGEQKKTRIAPNFGALFRGPFVL